MKRALLLIAACGSGHSPYTGDAPAAPDAPSIDGPGAAASVKIDIGATPQENVTVIFTNADGSPIATMTTDASGTASHELGAAGGYITAVDPLGEGSAGHLMVTWAGVQPGELVELAYAYAAPIPETYTVPLASNAASYTVQAMCNGGATESPMVAGSASATAALELPGCSTPCLLTTAFDGGDVAIATLWDPGVVFDGSGLSITSTGAFAPTGSATSSYTDLPADATGVTTSFEIANTSGVATIDTAGGTAGAGSASVAIPAPAIAGNTNLVETTISLATSSAVVIDWSDAPFGDYSLDLAGQLLPEISAPAFDLATDTITWTQGSGATPNMTLAEVAFDGDPTLFGWVIAAPYTAGSVQLPPIDGYIPAGSDLAEVADVETLQVTGSYNDALTNILSTEPFVYYATTTGRVLGAQYLAP